MTQGLYRYRLSGPGGHAIGPANPNLGFIASMARNHTGRCWVRRTNQSAESAIEILNGEIVAVTGHATDWEHQLRNCMSNIRPPEPRTGATT